MYVQCSTLVVTNSNLIRARLGYPFAFCVVQEVGAPFQDALDAADATQKESLAQHLQLVDKVPRQGSARHRCWGSFRCCLAELWLSPLLRT